VNLTYLFSSPLTNLWIGISLFSAEKSYDETFLNCTKQSLKTGLTPPPQSIQPFTHPPNPALQSSNSFQHHFLHQFKAQPNFLIIFKSGFTLKYF
jgi:hypothetical protein